MKHNTYQHCLYHKVQCILCKIPDIKAEGCFTLILVHAASTCKKGKGSVQLLTELHLTATECHLPYGITQCYLPSDTSEHTLP